MKNNENIELGNITIVQASPNPKSDNRSIRLVRRLSTPDVLDDVSQIKPRLLKKTNSLNDLKVSL